MILFQVTSDGWDLYDFTEAKQDSVDNSGNGNFSKGFYVMGICQQ